MAGNYDFLTYVGEDFDTTITWYDANTNMVNLTGYTASFQIATLPAPLAISTTSNSAGVVTLGGSLGTIRLQINNEAISALGKINVPFRLFITDLRPEISALLVGNFRTA